MLTQTEQKVFDGRVEGETNLYHDFELDCRSTREQSATIKSLHLIALKNKKASNFTHFRKFLRFFVFGQWSQYF